jgi:hypothetical protein
MAAAPTAEDSARRILHIFLEFGHRSGDVMQQNSFIAPFAEPGWKASDFNAGITFAISEGWLESVSSASYRLTDLGFGEAE